MSPLIKYAAPLLQFLLAVGGTLQLYIADNRFTALETWSFVAFLIAPGITWLVPLTSGPWPGILKTGLNAILGGVLVIVSGLEQGAGAFVLDGNTLTLIGLAVANALAVEIGVGARKTQIDGLVADPSVPNAAVAEFDRGAYQITTVGRHEGT